MACFNLLTDSAFARGMMHHGDPDSPHHTTNVIVCTSCHDMDSTDPKLIPVDPDEGSNIDDTRYNSLCLSCHNPDYGAPVVKTHSSLNTSDRYGNWTVECWVCHNQHRQEEVGIVSLEDDGACIVNSAALLYSGVTDAVSENTITVSGASWPVDGLVGMRVAPDIGQDPYCHWNYIIVSNTENMLTVEGPVDLDTDLDGIDTGIVAGRNFGIFLGKLMPEYIDLGWITDPGEPKSGWKYPLLFRHEGANSFADGDTVYDGICEVCHTLTKHFQNDGTSEDQEHANLSETVAGTNCIRCHSHENGFAHGGGSGIGCIECHGHDAGSYYDEDSAFPNDGSSNPKESPGRGTFQSHSTHTETDVDDAKGPGIYCDGCHDINNIPNFKDEIATYDTNGDGRISLDETQVCNPCHSPGGSYDGINDPVIGAKRIWRTGAFVATDDSTLRPDKQKWCAGCHDESPSIIASVNAPNVIGDEDGSYTYGTGWGYFKTGHGLPADETYPSKGGIETLSGRPVYCDGCHDFATAHIDGNARTFNCSDGCTSTEYRQSYRLKLVDGEEPMEIPWTGVQNTNSIEKYRLCVNCHASGPFVDSLNKNTNMYTWSSGNPDWVNRHVSHLSFPNSYYPADYNYSSGNTTKATCVICHNVHGSTRLSMVRDGKLINREPGQKIWNYNPAISTDTTPPNPEDLPLSLSSAARWVASSSGNLCGNCHGSPSATSYRTPFQAVGEWTMLDWTDEYSYSNDGAYPDSALPGSTFTFRVKYSSTNTDPPSVIQLWIDLDDDGSYETGEMYDLGGVDVVESRYYNGRLYTINLPVNSAGDDTIRYRFFAKDSSDEEASGAPTGDSYITLLAGNRPPELAWVTGACRHEGVSPAAEVSGSDFIFYVKYTDADGECPPAAPDIQVVVDGVAYDLAEVDSGDTDCADGKEYSRSITLATAGEIDYRFAASDGTDNASGEPTSNNTVTVINSTPSIIRVNASGGYDYTTIQEGIDNAAEGQTVLVYPAIYNEKLYFNGSADNNTIVRSRCGPDYTIIDADAKIYGVHVVNGSSGSVLDGFQITNGSATSGDDSRGVYLWNGSITIENCRIHGHTLSDDVGAGIYLWAGCSITVNNSEIYSNKANRDALTWTGNAGGVYIRDGSVSAIFNESEIIGNEAEYSGGGIYAAEEVILNNTILAANIAGEDGGGAYIWGGTGGKITARNCTIAENTAGSQGGAIFNWLGTVDVKNSILWNNTAGESGHVHYGHTDAGTTTSITDSVISNDNDGFFDNSPYFDWDNNQALTVTNPIGGDPFFVDAGGGDYHILHPISSAIDNANAADATEYDIDGENRPQGNADDIGADEFVSLTGNNAPVLTWTGESGYTDDGVSPDDGNAATTFIFRVDYTDADDDEPSAIQLWLDKNDDGVFGADEKYDLEQVDSGDIDLSDGKRYTLSLNIGYVCDGTFNYRFFAVDGTEEASGSPTSNRTITLNNTVPTLAWTGETNYTADGVEPNSAAGGSTFTFRAAFTDSDNRAPAAIQVWVDENDNDVYEPDEKYSLTVAAGEDGNYANGELFTLDVNLFYAGDGALKYRFFAEDCTAEAAGAPASDLTVTVENTGGNTAPLLSWTGEASYTADGVDPESGEDGNNSFTFRVQYSDADNDAPASIQLWLDINDDGDFSDTVETIAEKQDLTCTGSDYAGGVLCSVPLTDLSYAGDGYFNYRFSANDGEANATGDPAAGERTINVYHLLPVNCGSIQDAIDAAVNGDLILVGDCTYNENISFLGKEITVKSVNGPGTTIIAGDASNAPVARFISGETRAAVLDGFTIDNQATAGSASRGIEITNNSSPTIRNSVIKGNKVNKLTSVDGGGIYISNASAAIEGTTIGGDAANQNECDYGCGIYAESLAGPLTISDSTISQHQLGNSGSGIYLLNNGDYPTTITNSTISSNSATRDGGGIAAVNAKVSIIGSTLSSNEATNSGETGGALYIEGAGSSATIDNTEFVGNSATGNGGALYMTGSTETSPLNITGGSFTDNMSASANGGAVYLNGLTGGESVFSKVTINGNTSIQRGGGFYLTSSTATSLINCIISGNVAGNNDGNNWEDGGGIRNDGTVILRNCTVAGNHSDGPGGGMDTSTSTATITNSIFWDNSKLTASGSAQIDGSATVTYSDVDQAGYEAPNANNNMRQNPVFVLADPASAGTPKITGNYHIQSGSPVLDTGTSTGAPADDFDGQNRGYDGDGSGAGGTGDGSDYDMGADEYYP